MSPYERARERRLLNELSRINNEYATRQRTTMQELARSRHELTVAHGALGAVAHDLRSPLQAVLGFTEFLLEEDLDDHQRELVERIARSADQMSDLTEELLATMVVGGGALDRAPVDLEALVDDLVARYLLLGTGRDVVVRRAGEQEGKPAEDASRSTGRAVVLGDRSRLERVLENLVSNAVKFSPDGGTVLIGVEVTGAEVAVSVSDEGPGIDPADQEAVFHPFHRTSGSETVPGIGLGLSIVRQLVERHGGTVRVASVPGHGATFTARLPRWRD
jgi:signal transduction histidine kinase